jgi:excinuclease ABC subunit C
MKLAEPVTTQLDPEGVDHALEAIPNTAAVFLLWPDGDAAAPYLARTTVLQRRLRRLLGDRGGAASRLLNLRRLARRLEYWPVASRLEGALVQYTLARRLFPSDYPERLRLPKPTYVRLLTANPFPRTQTTTRLGSTGRAFGPFRTRAAAELFEHELLDLFQIRRCQEDLDPRPGHPGCIYGEMNLCLRPCQQAVTVEEYASEARRVDEFLSSAGRTLVDSITHARDRLSEEMRFEEAARQHRRLEKVQAVLKLPDELVRDVGRLCGVAVMPSTEKGAAELFFCQGGIWQDPRRFRFLQMEGKSMDERLRRLVGQMPPPRAATARERGEHLALLARWFYSSWRDGEWLPYTSHEEPPYRRMVRAISKALHGAGETK